MQSVELGLKAAFSVGDKDQVICKEQEQEHLPCLFQPIKGSMQLCPWSYQVALKYIEIQAKQERTIWAYLFDTCCAREELQTCVRTQALF